MRCHICQHNNDFRHCSSVFAYQGFVNFTVPLYGYIKTVILPYSVKVYQFIVMLELKCRKLLQRIKPETIGIYSRWPAFIRNRSVFVTKHFKYFTIICNNNNYSYKQRSTKTFHTVVNGLLKSGTLISQLCEIHVSVMTHLICQIVF